MEAAIPGEQGVLLVIPEDSFYDQVDNNSDELQRDCA